MPIHCLLVLVASLTFVAVCGCSAGPYIPELTEAAQRKATNYTGFVYDFATGPVSRGINLRRLQRLAAPHPPNAWKLGTHA